MPLLNLEEYQNEIIVRPMEPGDYDQVVALERLCYPGMATWSRDHFLRQLQTFAAGQLLVEFNGEVVAASHSLIVTFDLYSENHSYKDVTSGGYLDKHDPNGDTLYGVELMVHPEHRGMKLARRMYDARKALARSLNLQRIVIAGRMPGYGEVRDQMSPVEYVERVETKSIYDPVLTSQLSNGFVPQRIIPEYMPSDHESAGFAAYLEWTNIDYHPDGHSRYQISRRVRICCVQYQMRPIAGFDEFAKQCEYFVDVASGYKCDFVLFPELLTLQLLSFMDQKRPEVAARKLAEFTPQYLELFSDLAVRYDVNIIGGTHFNVEEDHLYNIAYLFKRSGEIDKQYKLHITKSERRWWGVEPGDQLRVFDTDRGRISIQICYDSEFPELSRLAVEQGAQILFVPFCTDERNAYMRVRYCAQARAIENQIFVAIAGTCGNLPEVENMDIQYAQSAILTPSDFAFARDGVASECTPNIETVVIHDLDLEALRRARRDGTTLNWLDRRHDLYEVLLKQPDARD